MEDYQKLYSFLPYFKERQDNRKNTIPQKNPFITYAEMTGSRYSEEMEQFADSVYSSGFIDLSYSSTLHRYGVRSDEELELRLPFADKALLKAILTKMIRSEQFILGAWKDYEEKGMFLIALQRLGELYGYSEKEGEKQKE